MTLPKVSPIEPVWRAKSFSDPDWIFEVKYDGFRCIAYIDRSGVRLTSKKMKIHRGFTSLKQQLFDAVHCESVILDGEIVCLDEQTGRPLFTELMRRQVPQYFYAFDLLWLDGRDLREVALLKRKKMLRQLVSACEPPLLYADFVEMQGEALFAEICRQGLEGVIAKYKHGIYHPKLHPPWYKILNTQTYREKIDRWKMFQQQ